MKTHTPKPEDFAGHRKWHVIDAADRPLGRLASEVAQLLRGKHRPDFAPHLDCGDHVIIINASQVALTGRKAEQKMHYHHTGYPGGIRQESFGHLREHKPDQLIRNAVKGMLPRTVPGREALRRLKVYAGPEHPHEAQQPKRYQF